LPLDVCLVRKLGLPAHPEMAMGSIAEDALLPDYSGEITIIDRHTTKKYGVKESEIQAIAAQEKAELRWRESCYRHYRPMLTIANRTIIVVDDGISTGLTMHAAVKVLSQHQPAGIIIATPVASQQAIARLKHQVDKFTCLIMPDALGAVGFWYEDFSQTTDREVCDFLNGQSCQNYAGSCFS
jgi:putative phosphoribosyl transferase